jgi:spermidine/putrescine-binding protein
MTGSSQQYPNVLAGASGSAAQVYSSDIIFMQAAGRNSCSVPGTNPAPPEIPQNAYVILPACYCVNTNGPTNNQTYNLISSVVSTTITGSTITSVFYPPTQNPIVPGNSTSTINTYNIPINNQSNPYLPAFDTYYSMKNPACQFPVPDQNQKHFVKQCHTRFPNANNGISVLCTDCTMPPYFTPSGQYIPPTCDGCIIETISSITPTVDR